MKQTISSPIRKLKLLLVLPLMAGVFYAFSAPEYKFVQASNNSEEQSQTKDGKTVTGKVVNEDGKPLKGASIVVSGKTIGTTTDANGNFKLEMPDDSPIVISYVGFGSQKVEPDFGKEMVISMKIETIGIDMGDEATLTQKRNSNIQFNNWSEISKYFEERKIQPLYVLDGEIGTVVKAGAKPNPKELDFETIESINILKGESATSKYGEKGKNGVVEIIRKKKQIPETKTQTNNTKASFFNPKIESIDSVLNLKTSLIYIDDKLSTKADVDQLKSGQIDHIYILKDQLATASYGDKGKNGVIKITTKKGDARAENENSSITQTIKVHTNSPFKFGNSDGSGNQPLIVKDGVIAKDQIADNISPETIESINVLKGESATKIYGAKGKNGVILIRTKKGESAAQNTPIEVKLTETSGTEPKPLIVIDGVIAENQNIDKIDPETIESMAVLKDESATKKYGEKGKNGVMEITSKSKTPFSLIEEMPSFPGGVEALRTFVSSTMKYPVIALENGIQGQVYVKFVVEKTGTVTNIKISRGVDPSLDNEALRIVKSMPKWNPGKQNGETVEVAYVIPVNFELKNYRPVSKEKLTVKSYVQTKTTYTKSRPDPKESEEVLKAGTSSKIGDINWVNNTVYNSSKLNSVLGIKKGDKYSNENLRGRVQGEVASLYLDNGYVFSNIEITEIPKSDGTVDLTFTVYEGNRGKIETVTVKGNKNVSTQDILDEIEIKPGDLFSKAKIIQSVRALSTMKKLNPEKISPEIIPASKIPNSEFINVNLVFNVTEK